MDDREKAYHSAQVGKNPNYYRELEFLNLEMFGLMDKELQQLMTPEDFKEYCVFLERLNKADTNT